MTHELITCIIIDDEKDCRDTLNTLLTKYCPGLKIVSQCKSAEEGITAIKKYKPKVVFLDVEMPKATGFDMLSNLEERNFELIFTTAFDQYAIRAFKYSAVDYLLKPIGIEDLKNAILKIKDKLVFKNPPQQLDIMFQHLRQFQNPNNQIGLPTLGGLQFVPIQQIIRCQAFNNYTDFFLLSKIKITVTKTLKDVEELLVEYSFFRIHDSHLVNLNHISKYERGEGGTVFMRDGAEVDVSRRKKDDFIKKLAELKMIFD